ncbi:MAG TPA: SpoIIE family protein phosphatase [Chloroflexota bacterium]|nr:SpoIIE family protein phosphatase [Chloroflexota bacterium]
MLQVTPGRYAGIYTKSTIRVITLACFAIVLSIIATGVVSYRVAENAVIAKLTSQDMVYTLKSISSQIDGRIQRAKETSLIVADNPLVLRWFESEERDQQLEAMAMEQVLAIARSGDYSNIFLANPKTGHYWTDTNMLTDTLSRDNPADAWFFDALASKRKISLNIDPNKALGKTMLWVNTLMGNADNPTGVAGVGVDIQDISREFRSYKIGKNSSLWLVSSTGQIYISADSEQNGEQLVDCLPPDLLNEVLKSRFNVETKPSVASYNGKNGLVDLIYQGVNSTDWVLVFQIDRAENVTVLKTIVINTVATVLTVIIFVLVLFFIISARIANPYKQALRINAALEEEVAERTKEIQEKNRTIVESIEYALAVQRSILPPAPIHGRGFGDSFVIWRPRDVVGGDFYWTRETERGSLLVVADCTGHGVAGAFMTMAVNSMLNNIVSGSRITSPTSLVRELDRQVKEAFNKDSGNLATDDGLDAAVCYCEDDGTLHFAGARMKLYLARSGRVQCFEGSRSSIGYIRSRFPDSLKDTTIQLQENDRLYITTDGYPDQNGGARGYSLGRRRFMEIVARCSSLPMAEQKRIFEAELDSHMASNPQRDDITVIGIATAFQHPARSPEEEGI